MTIAGIFPGQGSQSLGMLAELYNQFPEVKTTFEHASDIIGKNLWQIAQEGPEEALNSTENTQPLMLAAGIAVWRVWLAQGGRQPTVLAGHSLGEYSALVASDALEFEQAMRVVAERAHLMQSAVPEGSGAMAAILGLDDAQVIEACKQAAQDQVVEAVNFNSPAQVVIAGNAAAVERAIQTATSMGAKKVVKLSVSVPSHCALMKPAAEQLALHLANATVTTGHIPVLHNVDAQTRQNADAIRQALQEQLYKPVRWVETIQQLKNSYDISKVMEFGPGKVLAGLNKRIDRKMSAICVHDYATLMEALKLAEES